jgi:hypothetical protein
MPKKKSNVFSTKSNEKRKVFKKPMNKDKLKVKPMKLNKVPLLKLKDLEKLLLNVLKK